MRGIDLKMVEKLPRDKLAEYLGFMLWQYRLVDAFWFLYVERDFGLDEAVRLNEDVWQKMAKISASDIKRFFGVKEKGLKGFVEALSYFPWTVIVDYNIEVGNDEVIITVAECPPQVGRKKHGLDEFPCKEMHRGEFTEFARQIDPAIKVECVFAPPDAHPEEMYCKWRFTVEEG